MRKITVALVLITFALFAIPRIANATEIKFHVTIMSDNCLPQPYGGTYCVFVTVKHNGDIKCQFTVCNEPFGNFLIDNTTSCTDFVQEDMAHYEIEIRVCRQDLSGCCANGTTGLILPAELSDGSRLIKVYI